MFTLDNNPLKKDIEKIINYPFKGTNEQSYELYLHTKDKDIEITAIDSVEIMRDYNGNYTDYIIATFSVPTGVLIKDIYPYRDNLEITMVKISGNNRYSLTYKFILLEMDSNIIGNVIDNLSREELNRLGFTGITGQALYKEVEALRNMEVHGIYRDTTVKSVIISTIEDVKKRVQINGQNIDLNISIVEPNNNRKYQHIIIPNGIKLLDIPSYIDNKDYGVYNGYIGTYIQYYKDKLTIFIYPLYNHKVVKSKDKILTIFQVNSKQYELLDRTYIIDGDNVNILAHDSSNRVDFSDDNLINSGTGFRTFEPNSILNRSVNVESSDVKSNSNESVHKFRLKDLDDQIINTRLLKATDNMYIERSKFIKDSGSIIQLQWNFSYSELLYPGMPVLYYYSKNNKIIKREGILQSVYTQNNPNKKMSISLLNVFIENLSKGYENE